MSEVLTFDRLSLSANLLLAGFLLVVLILYSLYSILFYKQVRILNSSIQTKRAFILNTLALAHLLVSLGLLVIAAGELLSKI